MSGILGIGILVSCLLAGALIPRAAGGRFADPPAVVERSIRYSLWALLFVMGFRIGNDPSISSRLAELGLLAAATAILAVLGTVAAIVLTFALAEVLPRRGGRPVRDAAGESSAQRADDPGRGGGPGARFKAPAALLSIVAGGFLAGLVLPPLGGVDFSAITGWALDVLLFFIGMQFAQSGLSLRGTILKPATLLVPFATAFGTLSSSLLLVPFFHVGVGKALALSAGFGWYSLSGVLISNLGDPALGSAAFLANMFRETIALLSIPFLARTRLPVLAVGVGGATAMDVTFSITYFSMGEKGPENAPLIFASGALLSLCVPVLVPLFYRLG